MFFHDYNNRKAGIYKMPDISVLIIDDEPSILKAVSMTLKQEHIAVTCADNGTLALDILKANTFDLILLDIIMPDQDGFSILKVIRSSQNYTPVILLRNSPFSISLLKIQSTSFPNRSCSPKSGEVIIAMTVPSSYTSKS